MIAESVTFRPARDEREAAQRWSELEALDDATIRDEARSRLYAHPARTPLAVVLLHGFTNNPQQYARLAPLLHQRGHTVLVPRLPEHGDRDRLTPRLRALTAERVVAVASQAVDAATGYGAAVAVAGISFSGSLCAWLAQRRGDVGRAVCISSAFSTVHLPRAANVALERTLALLPDFFVWWDPRVKTGQLPLHAYPRFPTHALAQLYRIGDDVFREAKSAAPKSRSIVLVTNRREPAVNNGVTRQLLALWERSAPGVATSFEFDDLPAVHDIIEPEIPQQRIAAVYPTLVELIESR